MKPVDKIKIVEDLRIVEDTYTGPIRMHVAETALEKDPETFEPLPKLSDPAFVIQFSENPELIEFINEKVYSLHGSVYAVDGPTVIDPTNEMKYIEFDNNLEVTGKDEDFSINDFRMQIIPIVQRHIRRIENEKGFITNYFLYNFNFSGVFGNRVILKGNVSYNSKTLERGLMEPFDSDTTDFL